MMNEKKNYSSLDGSNDKKMKNYNNNILVNSIGPR